MTSAFPLIRRALRHRRAGLGTVLLAFFISLGLGGCSGTLETHGDRIEADRLTRITPGVQRKDDVAQLLGSPSSTAVFDDETWYYISSTVENRSIFERDVSERQVVVVRFDRSGVVQGVEKFGLERGREVALVDRETPSFGESQSFVDQIIGNLGRFNTDNQQQQRR